MTKAQHTAHRLRHLILIAGILYTVAALSWMVLPLVPFVSSGLFGDEFLPAGLMGPPLTFLLPSNLDFDEELLYGIDLVLVLGLLLLAQWVFLRPGRAWTARVTARGRPLKSVVITAAALAMLLTVGAIALLLELPDWWGPMLKQSWPVVIWSAMLILWGVWAWVFFVYWRQGDRYTQAGRMIRGLVAGSLIEVFIAIPVHVWATRQRECYCTRGTYTTLVLAGVVLLWAFGPGIILLYMREKYRHALLFPMCKKCGYGLTGNVSGVCPECGTKVENA